MFWTYCTLNLRGSQKCLDDFVGDHGLPGKPLSFGVLAGIPAFSDPQAIMTAWGASGPPEPQGIPFDTRQFEVRLNFRCPTAPPIPWFRRIPKVYPDLTAWLKYATEATGIRGEASFSKGVFQITEAEGDHPGVQNTIESVMRVCS